MSAMQPRHLKIFTNKEYINRLVRADAIQVFLHDLFFGGILTLINNIIIGRWQNSATLRMYVSPFKTSQFHLLFTHGMLIINSHGTCLL